MVYGREAAHEGGVNAVVRYHEQTKHDLRRSARSPGYMDWANQPDPFRHFGGAPQVPLDHPPPSGQPTYDALFTPGAVPPAALDRSSVSGLFSDSLALSAWKRASDTNAWSLRVNPSSGALHPTEGYLIAGPIPELSTEAAVYHYAPYRHSLERRVVLPPDRWRPLAEQLPAGAVLVALASIYWRESWKYGERAFRYCHHDVGHAMAAVAFSAATRGWQTRLIASAGEPELCRLLGLDRQEGLEAEQADCLLAISPRGSVGEVPATWRAIPESCLEYVARTSLAGEPNRLSREARAWPAIEEVARVCREAVPPLAEPEHRPGVECEFVAADRGLSAQQIIRQRRSAIDMDGRSTLARDAFYRLLGRLLPGPRPPFDLWPWRPRVSLALFVHRVADLSPGLYLLVRHPGHESSLREELRRDWAWRKPPGCPEGLGLWLLEEADCREAARRISCQQDIASDGVFAVGMLAEFERALRQYGAAVYPRLFWETGLIGQTLYLEAEAGGLRGTGIGCFFDDPMHEALGLTTRTWQSLYHFTVGGAVDDPRLQTLPPYAHLSRSPNVKTPTDQLPSACADQRQRSAP